MADAGLQKRDNIQPAAFHFTGFVQKNDNDRNLTCTKQAAIRGKTCPCESFF
jgi:hypothetical protein